MIRNRFAERGHPAGTQQHRRQNRKVILQQSNFPPRSVDNRFFRGHTDNIQLCLVSLSTKRRLLWSRGFVILAKNGRLTYYGSFFPTFNGEEIHHFQQKDNCKGRIFI